MSVRIPFDATTPHGRILARALDRLYTGESDLERVKRAMDAMQYDTGSGPTWAQIETELGIPAGQGQVVYSLVSAALSAMNVAALRNAVVRMEQG